MRFQSWLQFLKPVGVIGHKTGRDGHADQEAATEQAPWQRRSSRSPGHLKGRSGWNARAQNHAATHRSEPRCCTPEWAPRLGQDQGRAEWESCLQIWLCQGPRRLGPRSIASGGLEVALDTQLNMPRNKLFRICRDIPEAQPGEELRHDRFGNLGGLQVPNEARQRCGDLGI